MEVGIEAARWVVGRVLGSASGGVLEAWAASSELGPNIRDLRMELLYAQEMLNNARSHGYGHGPEIKNPALGELLQELRDLAYRADDVMDELDYFRIQDELDGTYHAADEHAGGCLRNYGLNARHTARAVASMLGCFSSKCSRGSTGGHDEEDEEDASRGHCGVCPCLGPKTPDDDEQEEDASPKVRCGAVWPCGRASSTPLTDQQGDQEVVQSSNEGGNGCMGRLATGASDTINTVGKHLPCCSVPHIQNDANTNTASSGRRFLCCARPNKAPRRESVVQTPKLKFDRVEISRTMKEIVEQLKPVCAKVSTILNLELLDSNRSIAQFIATSQDTNKTSNKKWHVPSPTNAMSRPITDSESIEPKLYGRKNDKSNIIQDITKGAYCNMDLTVLPIVGPGGIGKTTLTQYIYHDAEVQSHFEVKIWVCVSVDFNVHRLTQEIVDKLPNDNKPVEVEERLKSKRFLLVLDDMWDCRHEDEWKKFLVPFTKGQKGSVILVTTRFPSVAKMVKTTYHWKDLEGLDSGSFKEIFIAYAFGDNQSREEHRELIETGDKIVEKLKGSPLAAKTVGRLLKNHLDLGHWTRVLESKEWELQDGDRDIMPALKLSFDYLPFHLQKCFTYCALFPEDYKFGEEELIHFWIGLDILHSRGESKSIEEIGRRYLIELVNYGFFKKEEDEYGCTYYIIHDLLHDLAMKVSADECLSICSSDNVMRSLQTNPSIRHLSININKSSVEDRNTFDIRKEDFSVFGKRLKAENLHSLMLFGEHQDSFVKTFHGLLNKAKALRVILIFGCNYRVEDLFHNYLNLVHLRYLRIHNVRGPKLSQPPKNISRFYHLRVLDLQGCNKRCDSSRHMGNLLKLRHFLVPDDEMHASIVQVGRLKSLQELRRFEVRKEIKGFELTQMGQLLELCGSLSIDGLENVKGREEADEAKLMQKKHLQELKLIWKDTQSNKDDRAQQVLEGLRPHSNLLKLRIKGHGGATCPSWLGANLSVENLESLCLDGVAWKMFPPIGEFQLVNGAAEEIPRNIPGQHFKILKRIELVSLASLVRWVLGSTDQLLSQLEVLIIRDCPELVELSFPNCTCTQQEQKNTSFPRLQQLSISSCPKLLSLPPVPWTSSPCSVWISGVGLDFESVRYEKKPYQQNALSLEICGKRHAQDMTASFWTALDLDKITEVENLSMRNFSGKELGQMLSCMPQLSQLEIWQCKKITWLGVVEQLKEGKEEIAADGLLLLPPQLQRLEIGSCTELRLRPDSPHGGEEGGGLQGLTSLVSLVVIECPKFLASYLPRPSSSCFPFPTSLQSLHLDGVEQLAPLSNLASLTGLRILRCGDLGGGVDLGHLLAHGCLRALSVTETPNFFSIECSEEEPLELEVLQLESLTTDDVAGVLAAPFCRLLSSSLTSLYIGREEMERFTEQQDEALELLTSLQQLRLSGCQKLQCLPAGLQKLTKLTTLEIPGSPAIMHSLQKGSLPDSLQELGICRGDIRSLPKDILPNSLRNLTISSCSAIRSLPKESLPTSLQELEIHGCPSIMALPKGGLPSSLRLLDVRRGNSEELRRQCRKLIGTIPIVLIKV